jgi:hypothetical protein
MAQCASKLQWSEIILRPESHLEQSENDSSFFAVRAIRAPKRFQIWEDADRDCEEVNVIGGFVK